MRLRLRLICWLEVEVGPLARQISAGHQSEQADTPTHTSDDEMMMMTTTMMMLVSIFVMNTRVT